MPNPASPTIQDIKDVLEITDSSKDGIVTRLLNGAFEYVGRKTRRELSTGVGTRFYNGTGKGYMTIDDFQSGTVSQLALYNPDRTIWKLYTALEYVTKGALGTQDPIHYRIDIINAVSENPYRIIGPNPYTFPYGVQNVSVTANYGTWATLPAGLQNLIVDMVVIKFRRPRHLRSASVGGESLTFTDSDLDSDMLAQMEEYRKSLVAVWPS